MNYRLQIDAAHESLAMAEASYDRNLLRVRADEGLPIELLQAIHARASSLEDRTAAVAGYNRSQLRLLHATGQIGR
jgi:outer membrane protein TolC